MIAGIFERASVQVLLDVHERGTRVTNVNSTLE
jgi:hypothetical protein